MSAVELLLTAVERALAHWPLLAIIIVGQLAHELTHFLTARAVGSRAVIQIRLRAPMRVRYDEEGVSPGQAVAIGLTPTLAGLTVAVAYLGTAGWPAVTPLTVAGLVAWLLYTLPSRDDAAPLGPWLAPDGHEQMPEPLRSFLIGGSAMALAVWLPALPYPRIYMVHLTWGIVVGAAIYLAAAVHEHGLPDDSLVD